MMAWIGWFDRISKSNKLWRIPGSKRCCGSSDKLITAAALTEKASKVNPAETTLQHTD